METPDAIVDPSGLPQRATLQLEVACALEQVRPAVAAVKRFLTEHGCAPAVVQDCELAFVEACTNAIRYATPAGREQPVQVELVCLPHQIELRITDHAASFVWPEQASLPEPESEGGRGIYLIQALMDEATYLPGPQGNTLVLRKRCRAT